jgi:hypothetical protein
MAASPALSAIINVPADRPTIQSAIGFASSGDEIVIADGVYTGTGNVNVTYDGKNVAVRSASGDASTVIIDCAGANRAISIQNGETSAALQNVTIRNGFAGGGSGGGVRVSGSSTPTISGVVFIDNLADGGNGGGIIVEESGNPLIVGCTFIGNTSNGGSGGGICVRGSASATVIDCLFDRNFALAGSGAGLCSRESGHVDAVNSVFHANVSDGGHGGAFAAREDSTASLVNCTALGNSGGANGGFVSRDGSVTTIANCISWGNVGTNVGTTDGGASNVSYSNVGGGYAGTGNIDADPGISDPNGGDFSLTSGSPCIDAGDNGAVPGGVTTDYAGDPRFVDDAGTPDTGAGTAPIVDMGATEFAGSAGCLGDLDGDNDVDLADLAVMLADFGCAGGGCAGDLDGDGDTDLTDLSTQLSLFGTVCP